MRVINLVAENVKRLVAIDITPAGDIVTIAGRNGSGKTSTLDCLWWAIAGATHIQSQPIRKGENRARIKVTLGTKDQVELIVERRFTPSGSTLNVQTADGASSRTPQKVLDAVLGELTFDPLKFFRMKPVEQFDELKAIVKLDVDIDKLDGQSRTDFTRRTDLNRDARAKRAQADGIIVAPDLPDNPLDEQSLLDEMQRAGEHNTQLEQRKARRDAAAGEIKAHKDNARHRRERAAELRRQAETEESGAADLESMASDLQQRLDAAEALPEPIDVAAIRAKVEDARQVNAKLALRTRKAQAIAEAEQIEARARDLTAAIEARERAKAEAIAAAQMPIAGLGFASGDSGPFVTFNGVPLDQASSAEQLRVSLAIAIAANPKLRVIRIQDGSLLDDDSKAEITKIAKEHDFQVWLETVDTSGKVGFVIEDGAVVAVDGKPVEKPAVPAAA